MPMNCEDRGCHCQSEIGVEKSGRTYCSESCAYAEVTSREGCGCGHAGCSQAEELRASA